jgi:hypothetical protein
VVQPDQAITPEWDKGVNTTQVVYYIDVDGWRDRYVRMPQGANVDILRVESTGQAQFLKVDKAASEASLQTTSAFNATDVFESPSLDPSKWTTVRSAATGELVGRYQEFSEVYYDQITSRYYFPETSGLVPSSLKGYQGGIEPHAPKEDGRATWMASYRDNTGRKIYDLDARASYTVELASGVIQDLSGNAYAGLSGYSFTTQAAGNTVPVANQFVGLSNVKLVKDVAGNKSTVSFSITFNSASIDGQKVNGTLLDLDYDHSKVTSARVSGAQYDSAGEATPVWQFITPNMQGATPNIPGKPSSTVVSGAIPGCEVPVASPSVQEANPSSESLPTKPGGGGSVVRCVFPGNKKSGYCREKEYSTTSWPRF